MNLIDGHPAAAYWTLSISTSRWRRKTDAPTTQDPALWLHQSIVEVLMIAL